MMEGIKLLIHALQCKSFIDHCLYMNDEDDAVLTSGSVMRSPHCWCTIRGSHCPEHRTSYSAVHREALTQLTLSSSYMKRPNGSSRRELIQTSITGSCSLFKLLTGCTARWHKGSCDGLSDWSGQMREIRLSWRYYTLSYIVHTWDTRSTEQVCLAMRTPLSIFKQSKYHARRNIYTIFRVLHRKWWAAAWPDTTIYVVSLRIIMTQSCGNDSPTPTNSCS